MNTSKPISTISYNSPDFLKARLEELVNNHTIADWIFIKHDAEEDERKDHIHLWIEPNRRLDTMTLQDFFKEFDPDHPDKPLGCIKFNSSNLDDWILYSIHDSAYLRSKCESREFAYRKEDFVYCDEDAFEEAFRHAYRGSEWARRSQVLERLEDGTISEREAVRGGMLPLTVSAQLLAYRKLDRGGRSGHE